MSQTGERASTSIGAGPSSPSSSSSPFLAPAPAPRPDPSNSLTATHLLSIPPLAATASPSLAALHLARARTLLRLPPGSFVWWCASCGGLREGVGGAARRGEGAGEGAQMAQNRENAASARSEDGGATSVAIRPETCGAAADPLTGRDQHAADVLAPICTSAKGAKAEAEAGIASAGNPKHMLSHSPSSDSAHALTGPTTPRKPKARSPTKNRSPPKTKSPSPLSSRRPPRCTHCGEPFRRAKPDPAALGSFPPARRAARTRRAAAAARAAAVGGAAEAGAGSSASSALPSPSTRRVDVAAASAAWPSAVDTAQLCLSSTGGELSGGTRLTLDQPAMPTPTPMPTPADASLAAIASAVVPPQTAESGLVLGADASTTADSIDPLAGTRGHDSSTPFDALRDSGADLARPSRSSSIIGIDPGPASRTARSAIPAHPAPAPPSSPRSGSLPALPRPTLLATPSLAYIPSSDPNPPTYPQPEPPLSAKRSAHFVSPATSKDKDRDGGRAKKRKKEGSGLTRLLAERREREEGDGGAGGGGRWGLG